MLSSIVVAVDLERSGERALPVALALGQLVGLPVEIVTVASRDRSGARQVIDLDRRASALGVAARSIVVLHDDDPGRAIAAQVNNCDGALLVMATTARSALGVPVHGSVSEEVLGHVRQPVLLIGPNVQEPCHMAKATLVACVDGSDSAEAALPVMVSWARSFGGPRPWFVEVIPPLGASFTAEGGDLESTHVRSFVERLAADGIGASWRVLRGTDPVATLREFADDISGSVLVVTSERWPGSSHWYSTARKLVRWSPRPVLLVPADRPELQHRTRSAARYSVREPTGS